jgi:L-ribulose-5-phosphate 3-epimerase
MRTSVNGWTVGGFEGEVPVLEAAKTAQDAGFDAIELCFGAGELTPEASAEDLAALKQGIDDLGFEISSMATGYYWGKSLSSPDEAERAEAVAFTAAYLRAAQVFGVDAILVVPGAVDVPWDPSRPVVPAAQARELSRKSLAELLPVAEETGVIICVENVWNKFLTGPFEFADFIDSIGSPWVKAYFDVGNVLLYGYPQHWIEVLGGDRIGRVHVKNFKRNECGGTINDFTGSLLEGDVDWPAVFAALKAVGYDKYLTAEVLVSEKGMPDAELAVKVAQELRQLVDQYC